jgi:putative YphP/YqiW family bacilliredoxin
MYPEYIVEPMRAELRNAGFEELRTPEMVDAALKSQGTTLLVVNSVCGCAAAGARPGVIMSLAEGPRPEKLTTVFAGNDKEATQQARKYLVPYPPSSPAVALFKDGRLVHLLERHHIEGRSPEAIAANLKMAYERHCSSVTV